MSNFDLVKNIEDQIQLFSEKMKDNIGKVGFYSDSYRNDVSTLIKLINLKDRLQKKQ